MVLFISLFHNYKFSSLRIYAAVIHFVTTFFLTWTRVDCINAAITDVTDNNQYVSLESTYLGYIATAIIFIAFNFIVLLLKGFQDKSFIGVIQLFLDVCGAFFCMWISLDGWEWNTYINVWFFCAFSPFTFNLVVMIIKYSAKTQVAWDRNRPNIFVRWWRRLRHEFQELTEAIQSLN